MTGPQTRVQPRQTALKPLLLPIRPRADTDGQNARRHHMAKSRRANAWARALVYAACEADWPRSLPWPRATVTITCIAARGQEMDDDNLAGCCKAVRDSIAKWFGRGDAPGGPVTWRYRWERGPDGTRIELTEEAT